MRRLKFLVISLAVVSASGCLTHTSLIRSGLVAGPVQDDASTAVTVSRATDLEKKGDWAGASEIYRFALGRKAKDKELLTAHAAFMKRRGTHLARLEVDMLIAQAQWLERQRIYEEAAQDNWNGRKAEERMAEVANTLARRGEEALGRNDLQLAKRAVPLAVKLQANPITLAAHQKWLERVKKGRTARQQRQAGATDKKEMAQK